MANVINFNMHRKMRTLQKQCDAIFRGRGPLLLQTGRTPGKTMTVDQILEMLEETRTSPWVSVGGRAADMIKQLPTAQVLQFRRPASN